MITKLCISGYRSLRDIRLALGPLNVVTGASGSGKSSLYRALRLLADIARGRAIRSLALEGGLPSVLWAGPEAFSSSPRSGDQSVLGTRRKGPIGLKLGFGSREYGYAVDLGLPLPGSMFDRDPDIKSESVWTGDTFRRTSAFAARNGPAVRLRDKAGVWQLAMQDLAPFDSMLTHCANPREAIELLVLREQMREWRFYDHFRTDAAAPARQPRPGARTPVLAADGADLAAAIATIREIGDVRALDETIADAFSGARIETHAADGYFELSMQHPGLSRPLKASELPDRTLRFLLLTAALLSPRPPSLMVLNEPETSLHPGLLPPLARLIVGAARRSRIVVVSHAADLAPILRDAGAREIVLAKQRGETAIANADPPAWTWPSR